MKDCLIIIPVFNEVKTISNIVKKLKKQNLEILVVDDLSTDNGCTELAEKYCINVIRNKRNIGYENTLKKGFEYAIKRNFKYAITFDGDGEHSVSSIPKILNSLTKGNLVVIGEREKKNRISETILHYVFLVLFSVSDPLSGLKGYDIKKLTNNEIKFSFESAGTSILIQSIKKNLKVCSKRIKTNKRIDKSRYGYGFKVNLKILKNVLWEFLKK